MHCPQCGQDARAYLAPKYGIALDTHSTAGGFPCPRSRKRLYSNKAKTRLLRHHGIPHYTIERDGSKLTISIQEAAGWFTFSGSWAESIEAVKKFKVNIYAPQSCWSPTVEEQETARGLILEFLLSPAAIHDHARFMHAEYERLTVALADFDGILANTENLPVEPPKKKGRRKPLDSSSAL